MKHGQWIANRSVFFTIDDTLLLLIPPGSKEPQAVNVVAIGALGLDLAEHLFVIRHDPKVNRQLLDRDALPPRHFLHESRQEVALVEEAWHPELADGEGIVRGELE